MALHTKFLTEGISHAGILIGTQQRYSVGEQGTPREVDS
jgi:hypothetical protein